jgi:phenylacetate-CoA ligase
MGRGTREQHGDLSRFRNPLSLLHGGRDPARPWDAANLERIQFKHLEKLVRHARETVPYYRDRIAAFDASSGEQGWRTLPILTRRHVQENTDALLSERIPARAGKQYMKQSSGSTGEPVRVVRTDFEQLYWTATTLRDHLWHRRDLDGTLCAIRAHFHDGRAIRHEIRRAGWGPASDLAGGRGKLFMLPIATDPARQADWLLTHDPHYLLSYPTNLMALGEELERRGARLERLHEVRTVGETLTPNVAERLRAVWNVPVTDLYSTEDVGIVALQCPAAPGVYHIQSETLKVEIVDTEGRPCPPGVAGRVVVSNLHNFAMPLLRYDLGDYAEAGEPCSCGRGLPTLRRIVGRLRNMLVLPNGERRWPLTGCYEFRGIAPISRSQIVQLDTEHLELRVVAERRLTRDEERRITEVIHRWIGHPFHVRLTYLDAFPQNANGKFEDFISLVAQNQGN